MKKATATIIAILVAVYTYAGPHNIAPLAKVTASSFVEDNYPENVIDGKSRILDKHEWVPKAVMPIMQRLPYQWIQLEWETEQQINKVVLYDRAAENIQSSGGFLHFSDGSKISVCNIPDDGSPKVVEFPEKTVKWIKFEQTDAVGSYAGLSEIEVFPSPSGYKDFVSYVDPYIETTKGRFFFCVTGSLPYGMISAAPMTRNRNQHGGGYNYNSTEILGFPQIHNWVLAGLTFMPVTGEINPCKGEQAWKSDFRHEDEVIQPGYHKVFLEDYNMEVEQTATDRVSFYRMTAGRDGNAKMLFNVGGFLASTTMVNAKINKVDNNRIEGSFDTYGRLWGGPENVEVFFAAEFDRPFSQMDGWRGDEVFTDINQLVGSSEIWQMSPSQNHELSYLQSPTSGVSVDYENKAGDTINLKMSISYVSCENAWKNIEHECSHWNFDKVKENAIETWNEQLGKIAVSGGRDDQRVKLYTDLWHVLLGRHKLNDSNGQYPDITEGRKYRQYTLDIKKKIRQLPLDENENAIFNMYNSDSFWLSQWNLNILWGLAWPEVQDDFAACLIQYADNGKLIPRGPCGGGYTYIMTGCSATPLIVSAYQKGIMTKTDPNKAFKHLQYNHGLEGMIGIDQCYLDKGYIAGNAGRTLEANFQDWCVGQMAGKLGKLAEKEYYLQRSHGWKSIYNDSLKLILPKKGNGEWLTLDPFTHNGWIEANAWQATWSISHDLSRLAKTMGGEDVLCDQLNFAFENSVKDDFCLGFASGYIRYNNQPGCSNAHVFSWAGKPWLTQYWVRQVNSRTFGAVTPDLGYGGHDEDQGQMGGVSALMSIGLFSTRGTASSQPVYEITSPVFDEVTISLNRDYYTGNEFKIKTYNNSDENCYIQKVRLNGKPLKKFWFYHEDFAKGGLLEIWLGKYPNKRWGVAGNPE